MAAILGRVERLELPGEPWVVGIRADNPGPFSLAGTNTWIVGEGPAWLVDPGPDQPAHVDAVSDAIERRGGLGGIALTHDHPDHCEALPRIAMLFPGVPIGAARAPARLQVGDRFARLADGDRFGPLEALATPGHAPDHLSFLAGRVAFTGDAVLGAGSVFVAPDPGALRSYLAALERLRDRRPAMLAPGHGPVVLDAGAKLAEYIAHRLDRERRLESALHSGCRTVEELLDAAWSDAPAALRPAAALTLAAHLDKLEQEGRLPQGVERPQWPVAWLTHA